MARNILAEYRELREVEEQEAGAPPRDSVNVDIPLEDNFVGPGGAGVGGAVHYDGIVGMEAFERKASEVVSIAGRLEGQVSTVRNVNSQLEAAVAGRAEENLKQVLDGALDEGQRLIEDGREGLRMLQASRGGNPTLRKHLYDDAGRQLRNATQRFLLVKEEVASSARVRFARQVRIVKPDATEEQVMRIVETGDLQSFLRSDLTGSVGSQRRMLEDVGERQKALERILASVMELGVLVQQLDEMITNQQFFVDEIETTVIEVRSAVITANQDIAKATDYGESARKKQWQICAIVSIVLLILIIIIAIMVASNSKKK
ncbi:Plasma membrane t-SNARE, secretory vesicle fusion [Phlyctochytrium planicorne]|nr:Plasma membrane t-SNARE, secretory vesicle fusion [Phlyctochytrium planicorne]